MRLEWDQVGKKLYETGTSYGVIYPVGETGDYPKGEPWNGLISVKQNPSGAEPTPLYANDHKYLELMSNEEFGGTIEAYTYPDGFAECDGSKEVVPGVTISQQPRKSFGLTYRTILGNDVKGNDYGYKLHLVWGAKAKPSGKEHSTVNDSPEAITMSWEFSTTPVNVKDNKPTAHMTIDSSKADPLKLKALEDILYGTQDVEARLPLPDEVIELLKAE